LSKQDEFGRIPLHYGSELGLTEVCKVILKSMKAWEELGTKDSRSAILLKDKEGRSPLHLSILQCHLDEIRMLIESSTMTAGHKKAFSMASSELMLLATRISSKEALSSLLRTDPDINCCDALGRTPLYIAAQAGNEKIVNLLLSYNPSIDAVDIVKSWTPLIVACIEGIATIATALLKLGARVGHSDRWGWTAIDYAGYHSHIPLTKLLAKTAGSLARTQAMAIYHGLKTPSIRKITPRGQPRRSISTTESHIVVNLGPMDSSVTTPAVSLSPHLTEGHSAIRPESFYLQVSIAGHASLIYNTPLPLLEDTTNTPWIFRTTEPTNVKLVFELFYNGPSTTEGGELIGRGMTILGS
jgi:hypothetical protein